MIDTLVIIKKCWMNFIMKSMICTGMLLEVIFYADKATEWLRCKPYKLVLKNNKKYNVAVAAIARELACFAWG